MRFQIKNIVLWPRHAEEPPRILSFEPGAVNVVTGASKTGKSAILPIIDYCLGSGTCAIPVGTIRDSCSWFGVLVETEAGERLYCRREPETKRSTSAMYVLEGNEVEIPDAPPERNASVADVRLSLDELSGLTQLPLDPRGESGYSARPSFRDMAAFNFQPQNIVANPNVLFFKADTVEHREKLRRVFPFVLGAVTAETLAIQNQLHRLEQQLRAKSREAAAIKDVSQRWVAEVRSKIDTARELGLIADTSTIPDDLEEQIALLRAASEQTDVDGLVSAKAIGEAAGELADLRKEEGAVSARLGQLRRRLSEMDRLKDSARDHGAAMGVVRDRLQLSKWFSGLHEESSECPICGNEVPEPVDNILHLVEALETAERTTGKAGSVPAAFDREYERVRAEIDRVVEEVNAVSIRRRALARDSDEAQREQFRERSMWRFLGELVEALDRFDALRSDEGLNQEIADLSERISGLKREVDASGIQRKTQQALRRVDGFSSRLLPELNVERPDDPVSLSIKELSASVAAGDRDDWLYEVGSGANWLSYHVAVLLGLHQYFRTMPQSPVPSFLVLDQPSQVYFPRRAAAGAEEGEDPELADEDIIEVRRVFSVLADSVTSAAGGFQAIVLDHAAYDVWGELPAVSLVEEWRDGKKLVPESWIRASL